jgi:hypothetical protein
MHCAPLGVSFFLIIFYMANSQQHNLVALQLNLGGARKSKRAGPNTTNEARDVSKLVSRYLINQYLKQSIIFDPAFIALHDVPNGEDTKSVREAIVERTETKKGTYLSVTSVKTAVLMYDSYAVEYDANRPLVEDDFFAKSDIKARKLFKRLDGGLFFHKQWNRWIVAVSYHGEKTESRADEKKENVIGIRHFISGV